MDGEQPESGRGAPPLSSVARVVRRVLGIPSSPSWYQVSACRVAPMFCGVMVMIEASDVALFHAT